MKKEYIIILSLIIIIIALSIWVGITTPVEKNCDNMPPKLDTVIIRVPFEKVKEKIVIQKVKIEQYKQEYEKEIQKANTIADSDAVALFYQLASGK